MVKIHKQYIPHLGVLSNKDHEIQPKIEDDDYTLSSDISSISTDFSANDSLAKNPLLQKENSKHSSSIELPSHMSEDYSKLSDGDMTQKTAKTFWLF